MSQPILDETRRVLSRQRLRRRYPFDDVAVDNFIAVLSQFATLVSGLPSITVVRDPADDVILATAIAGRAALLVTRDKDLLDLGTYQGVEMITPEALLMRLRQP